MKQEALTKKILVLGIDGMDPRLTRKYVSEGKMPNVKKFIEAGSAREDLVLLGAMPTVTPPMWTTLATGAYPNTHGITDFYGLHEELDTMTYNLDSNLCKAEQVWNVLAEAGKKTLVWHWPGSSWPPTSDSPNLHVVDGAAPGGIGSGSAQVDGEYLVLASEKNERVLYLSNVAEDFNAPCVITGLDIEETDNGPSERFTAKDFRQMIMERYDGTEFASGGTPIDAAYSPIKEPEKWNVDTTGAKEFTLLMSRGAIRRPALILKNENGVYDKVAIYRNKKELQPIVVLEKNVYTKYVIDEGMKGEKTVPCSRSMRVLEIAEDGSALRMYVSAGMNTADHSVWHPAELFEQVTSKHGPLPPSSLLTSPDPVLTTDCQLAAWYQAADWQAEVLNDFIENNQYDVIFSHFHNVDIQNHTFIRHLSPKYDTKWDSSLYRQFEENVYIQTDYYLGKFTHLLDSDWTIMILSDHALVCPKNNPPMIGDMIGCNVRVMQELGYTVLKTDENGNELPEIDWSKTKAVATRGIHIMLNLKGRNPHGIVEPEDKYALEEQIITDLYGYRDKTTGQRVIALALHNKDAAILGLGGPLSGDIVYFLAEGYNYDHADSLSTTYGEADTSVSPIFIAAGPGIKKGYTTERVIRQVDVAPTIAVLGGVRMPAQCEGAPAYQILDIEG